MDKGKERDIRVLSVKIKYFNYYIDNKHDYTNVSLSYRFDN